MAFLQAQNWTMQLHNNLGLHLRLDTTLQALINDAKRFQVKTLQFFLTASPKMRYLSFSNEEQKEFLALNLSLNGNIFVHSSYWINPASGKTLSFDISKSLLQKEMNIARRLAIPYIVLHPGSATDFKKNSQDPLCKQSGLERVASLLNTLLKKETFLPILLENTAHANRSIGSDLNDFIRLKEMLNHPEKVQFCLDLAHAFSYGYDVHNSDSFLNTVDKTMGFSSLKLIHFNDSAELCGSKKDKHAVPGAGYIGIEALKKYLLHPKLQRIPKIIELPSLPPETIHTIYNSIITWYNYNSVTINSF